MNAKEKIEKSRTQFVLKERYFATVLMNLPAVEDKSCQTLWTNGRVVGYNPKWAESKSESELTFCNVHEMMHVTNRHHLRRGERDPQEWNICCDYSINPVVLSIGYKMPEGALFEKRFVGKTAEEIYVLRRQEKSEKEEEEKQKQKEEENGRNDSSSPGREESSENKTEEESQTDPSKPDDTKEEEGSETKQDSQSEPEEESEIENSDPGQCGEIRDMKNEDGSEMSEADRSAAEVMTKVMIAQAARVASQAGQMTEGLERIIGELQKPTQDWRAELSQYLQQYAKNDYTWMVPNRRYVHAGLYLPSMRNQELGNVFLVLDSSGSINDTLWNTFVGEMKSLMEMFNLTLTVIVCDNAIRDVRENISSEDICEIKPKGYGGTDFRPPFEWIEKNGFDPTLLIYFTDLDCSYFPADPGYPVVWASWGYEKAPFGHVIKLK
uniref:Metallopeptidase domain-containing protein n=1 Tax=viral metagenome TaxID=1070528 RepID=A0A6M3K4Z3_9ZZZZ